MEIKSLIKSNLKQIKTEIEEMTGLSGSRIELGSVSYTHTLIKGYMSFFKTLSKNELSPDKLSVLDIGVGKGWTSFLFSKIFKKVRGFDLEYTISEHSNIGTKRWQEPFWNRFKKDSANLDYDFFDGIKFPLENETFDIAFAQAVIEHVGNNSLNNEPRRAWLKEINRILKPGGILYISECPNLYSYSELLATILKMPHHEKKFKKKELIELIESQGYEILSAKYTHPYIEFFPGFLQSVWNFFYLIIFKWIEPFFLIFPFNRIAHHYRIIARKK